jgi:hypothetical protein
MAVLHRLAAILAGLAGLLFALVPLLHPPNTTAGALEPAWVPVHLAWLVSYVLILFALPTLFMAANRPPTVATAPSAATASSDLSVLSALSVLPDLSAPSPIALTGFLLAFVGTALSLTIATYDTFIVPTLAANVPPLIELINRTVEEPGLAAFHATYYLAVATFSLGFILLGLAMRSVPAVPRWAGPLLAVGAPLFWLGLGFRDPGGRESAVTMAGAVLFGIGLIAVGQGLARHRGGSPSGDSL